MNQALSSLDAVDSNYPQVEIAALETMYVKLFSPNRFTCEGFLLLLKGCMLGPDDFEFVSGLVFLAA